jgi:hypothetical protein
LSEWKAIHSLLDIDLIVWGGVDPQPFQIEGAAGLPPLKISTKSPSQFPPEDGSKSRVKVSLEILKDRDRIV